MSDLISRQAAINAIENTDAKMSMTEWDEITDAVMSVPSAQPEIIYCKDCIHNTLSSTSGNILCDRYYGFSQHYDFCSRAERRTDE